MKSLSLRITLTVTVLLAACGIAAGVALHRAFRNAAHAQLRGRLDTRLAWLEGALDVEMDDGEVQLDAREEPAGAAEAWKVSDDSGRTLWSSDPPAPIGKVLTHSKPLSFGPATAPPLPAQSLTRDDGSGRRRPAWDKIPLDQVPPPVLAAARAAVPEFKPADAWQRTRVKKKDKDSPATYELRGRAADRDHELRIDAAGKVLSARHHESDQFPGYQFAAADDDRRLDLTLTAIASTTATDAELAATARVLWTLGPLALLATAVLLALAIRWQLAPLSRMARQAARIGPADVAQAGDPIGPVGTSDELVHLRGAINSMLARLAQALARERRFASTAAHELRTPLAQMRLSLEVALRKQRDAAEYRQALHDIAGDIERLQRLVVGLLQLTRSTDTQSLADRRTALGPLLAKAAESRGPARLDPTNNADGLWIHGDPELLLSAIGNVLENANRHAPGEPPTIGVQTSAGDEIHVLIADRGPGIAEQDRERIFEPLTRLHSNNSDGLGLGLAVARESARAAGGDLTCRPRSDGTPGAEFVFRFRRAAPPDDR